MSALSFSARDVAVFRGERCLISGLSLSVNAGDIIHLVGPNGCGKTSLMRILAGLGTADQGDVLWEGRPLSRVRSAFLQNMAWLGHQAGLKGDLTLMENLTFDNALRRRVSQERLHSVLVGLGLDSRQDVFARGLSAGQRRRLALARVLISDAALWLLDEPFTNLDTEGQGYVRRMMAEHANAGGALIFAAHHDVVIDGVNVRRLEWRQ